MKQMFSWKRERANPTRTETPSCLVSILCDAQVRLPTKANQQSHQVLLRVLEYYQGIMILTTNRIKYLDAAVQSRIHLAVRFEDLNSLQMRNILETILRKFKVAQSDLDDIMSSFKEYLRDGDIKLNGREIRNLVFSAHAIALSQPEKCISWSNIKEVLRVTRQFQKQLEEVTNKQRYWREAAKKGAD
ncbi:MAG: hypothetical protein Q9196_003443 [Gyalolechia fulgens]